MLYPEAGDNQTATSCNGKEMLGENAIELAEMALILADLNTSVHSLNIIKRHYLGDEITDEEWHIKCALFRDAVNLYVAAFSDTCDAGLDLESVYSDVEGFRDFFQWAADLRNSYSAHTFGPGRQCVTILMPDPVTGLAIGVGPFSCDWDPVTPESVGELAKAASIAASYAGARGKALNDQLFADAKKMSADTIAALPPAQIHIPGPTELRQNRHSFRRAKTGQARLQRKKRPRPPRG